MNYKNNFKSAFGELLGTSWGNQDPDSNEATDNSSPKEEEIVFLKRFLNYSDIITRTSILRSIIALMFRNIFVSYNNVRLL